MRRLPAVFLCLIASPVSLAAQPPQTHPLPPSAIAEFGGNEGPVANHSITRRNRTACTPGASAEEIVVCGRIVGGSFLVGAIDPEWERRYGHRPEGPSAGVQIPSSAMDASRCAVVRCPPQGMISIFGRRF